MKTTLTVEIEYDPEITDSEALACAMDRLLETALSTPDILDEYGNPKVGEFFVSRETTTFTPVKYTLNIDGKLFRSQRELLMKIADLARQKRPYSPMPGEEVLWEGLLELTDELADQAHDQHGIDCLLGETG